MTTRMVSPTPLSDFVPDVTLIAFPIPVAIARGGRAFSSREAPFVRAEKMTFVLISGAKTENSLRLEALPAAF
jgi:hypothetical protein